MAWANGHPVPEDAPAQGLAVVTTNVAFPPCRGLLVGTAGTATITDVLGNVTANVPLQAGFNPIACTKVVFGTVSGVFALY